MDQSYIRSPIQEGECLQPITVLFGTATIVSLLVATKAGPARAVDYAEAGQCYSTSNAVGAGRKLRTSEMGRFPGPLQFYTLCKCARAKAS